MSTGAVQDRPSGIPRFSRLPRPISIPHPPTPSSSTSSIRPMSSRESLSAGLPSTRDQFSPQLRSSLSRNSVHSTSSAQEVKPFVRHCACKDQLRPGVPKAHSCSKPAAAPKPTRTSSASRRWSTVTQNPTLQYKPWAEPLPGDPDRDDYVHQSSPSGDMHESLLASYLNGTLGNSSAADDAVLLSPVSDCFLPGLNEPSLKRPGPSLTERTVETLSRLPSSPAGSRKSSSFYYDDSRRNSVADDTASSRPDSSYFSELSSGLASPVATKAPVARRPQSMISPRISSPMSEASESSFHVPPRRSCGGTSHGSACSRAPPRKKVIKGVSIRPPRDLSISTITTTSEPDQSGPTSAGWDGRIRPAPHAALGGADQPDFRKSSSALRDHIARAKAAKRAALKQAGGDDGAASVVQETLGMPNACGFDESPHDDPFNHGKGGNKIVKQRIGDARTSGRLNVAALGLKEIPGEVMKMYDFETIQASGGTWSDSVDLKRFIAPDNELEKLDDQMFPDRDPAAFDDNADGDAPTGIFGGLETMDLHGNQLVSVPVGLRRLAHLTSLNVSLNRLANDCLGVITQIASLRDLKLAQNCLAGPLDAGLANLTLLETLDVHGNHISALPCEMERLTRLRVLNLSENNFETIAFESLAKLPLIELDLKRNKLSGTLVEDPIECLPRLQTLDVSSNRLTRLVPEGASLTLPDLHTLLLSMNRLQELPDMSTWTNLLTLIADSNSMTVIPESFALLSKLRQADLSSNDIKVVPPEVARMEDLSTLRLSGNPLREKKLASMTADAIKVLLATRLEPARKETAPIALEEDDEKEEEKEEKENEEANEARSVEEEDEEEDKEEGREKEADQAASDAVAEDTGDNGSDEEEQSTPATSTPPSPSEANALGSTEPAWQVKSGGLLDRSRSESATLDADVCAEMAAEHKVYHAQLHHNLYMSIPAALSAFAETLTTLALGHNKMAGETYLVKELELPSLSELNLTSNHITSMEPLTRFLRAPLLQKIDISMNRLSALPSDLKQIFPKMTVLLASHNQLVELDPVSIKGLQVVDVSSNDIAHLDPRIGLLGGRSGLQRLEVMNNRFRVPRWNILEQGTEYTMSWLRDRVSAADMEAWKVNNGDDCGAVEDELD